MKVTITEVFCEIISGLMLLIVLSAISIIFGWIELSTLTNSHTEIFSAAPFASLIVFSYILGIIFDPIGMAFDLLIMRWLGGKRDSLTNEHNARFYQTVSNHVLSYRLETWAYYFCFRNLFVLLPLAVMLWCEIMWSNLAILAVVLIALVTIGIMFSLWKTMDTLLDIYYTIVLQVGTDLS